MFRWSSFGARARSLSLSLSLCVYLLSRCPSSLKLRRSHLSVVVCGVYSFWLFLSSLSPLLSLEAVHRRCLRKKKKEEEALDRGGERVGGTSPSPALWSKNKSRPRWCFDLFDFDWSTWFPSSALSRGRSCWAAVVSPVARRLPLPPRLFSFRLDTRRRAKAFFFFCCCWKGKRNRFYGHEWSSTFPRLPPTPSTALIEFFFFWWAAAKRKEKGAGRRETRGIGVRRVEKWKGC